MRSAGIRFAVIYAGVFGISSFTLAFSLWYATVGLLQHQVQLSVHNDVAALEEHYETGGPAALIGAVRNRIADSVGDDGIYLLHDPMGNRIAGNLDRWPKGLNLTGTWYQLVVNRKGIPSVALLWFETLPDGERLLVGRDMQARAELRTVLRDGLLWAVGLMSVLGLLGAVLIRSLFRRMIRDISATARAIALGDLTRRIPITGEGDEFEELADIINDMLDRIARLMDGVRQVSNAIAHDLRTPITRARTRLEDAAMHAQTKEDLHQAIERATDDLDGIVGVFEALLRIAEIEAGSRRAAFAFINLAPMLNDMDELYSAVAEERGLVLQSSIDPHLPMLGDRELVQQAVANLLDNALKFSKPGTTITLTAKAIEAGIEIAVADCGPGIAPQDRARATERFFRAESARSTSGSGLGLALVAAVAQLHNGAFSLSDNNPGLRARMLLPAKAEVGSPGRDED
ncbi:MAG: two-component sensor histidine kinase [Acidocella sp. 20-63-7]|nr:MAG: two-component sensor histidine kinase [Acidocella sp. 20-63-7]